MVLREAYQRQVEEAADAPLGGGEGLLRELSGQIAPLPAMGDFRKLLELLNRAERHADEAGAA